MSQQSRILAGVFCSGMAAALIAMAALQLPNWLQQRKMAVSYTHLTLPTICSV